MIRLALIPALIAGAAFAHDGVKHKTQEEAAQHLLQNREVKAAPEDDGAALPFDLNVGGPYRLTSQHGEEWTEADPEGRLQLVFFGYAKCQAICTVALPRMAEMADIAAEAGLAVRPVLITVDPARDTVEALAEELPKLHPDMIGLTGTEEALEAARKAFHIERKLVFDDPEYGPIYAHGSHIYLMDGAGQFLTFIPPILSPDRGAEIIAKYAAAL